jgi:hypothetical protein
MAGTGAHAIPVRASGANSPPPTVFQGVSIPNTRGSNFLFKIVKEQSQQHLAQLQGRPLSTVEDVVIVGKGPIITKTHYSQCRGYRPSARRQDRSWKQHLGMPPDSPEKSGANTVIRLVNSTGMVSMVDLWWLGWSPAYPAFRFPPNG